MSTPTNPPKCPHCDEPYEMGKADTHVGICAFLKRTKPKPAEPLNMAQARQVYEMLLDLRDELRNSMKRIEREVERFQQYK